MKQIEIRHTQNTPREQRYVEARQVVAPDGRPAVRVVSWRSYRHSSECAAEVTCTGSDLYCFSSARPVEALGRPVVGQWSTKAWQAPDRWWELPLDKWQAYKAGKDPVNPDETTYQDYFAWAEAFHQVYSQS